MHYSLKKVKIYVEEECPFAAVLLSKIIRLVRRSQMANNIPKDYELPLYLFHDGTNMETYKFLGCHKGNMMGKDGYFFRVWAAHAKAISLVGDFNNWDETANPMTLIADTEI